MRRRSLPVLSVLLIGLLVTGIPGASAADAPDSSADPASLIATWFGSLADALRIGSDPSGAEPVEDPPPLPRCRYRDKPTRYGEERQWRMSLLDTNLQLPADYEPWDLVAVRRAGLAGSGRVRKLLIERSERAGGRCAREGQGARGPVGVSLLRPPAGDVRLVGPASRL